MKTWEKPKLIVLVRSKPEEALLPFCKSYDPAPLGPANLPGLGCSMEAPGVTCHYLGGS